MRNGVQVETSFVAANVRSDQCSSLTVKSHRPYAGVRLLTPPRVRVDGHGSSGRIALSPAPPMGPRQLPPAGAASARLEVPSPLYGAATSVETHPHKTNVWSPPSRLIPTQKRESMVTSVETHPHIKNLWSPPSRLIPTKRIFGQLRRDSSPHKKENLWSPPSRLIPTQKRESLVT